MKLIVSVIAMVMLSGVAWGQEWTKEDLERLNKDPCTTQFWKAMSAKGVNSVTPEEKLKWCAENYDYKKNAKGKINIPDPTDPEVQLQVYDLVLGENKIRMPKPNDESRYRLERNEITGKYRITEDGNPVPTFAPGAGYYDNMKGEWFYGTDNWTKAEWLKELERLREVERTINENRRRQKEIDKAWVPVK